jgi:predicted protein tyrosine phosphatase
MPCITTLFRSALNVRATNRGRRAKLLMDNGWPTRAISLIDRKTAWETRGPNHLVLRFEDVDGDYPGFVAPDFDHVIQVLDFTKNLTDSDKLLVNCHMGCRRSPAMALGVLIQHGMTPEDAYSDRYEYTNTEYITSRSKCNIICKLHGAFTQSANGHLNGQGCPKCSIENRAVKKKKSHKNTFVSKATAKHNGFYDYSLVEYTGCFHPVSILCPAHGEFRQKPSSHLYGSGCGRCFEERRGGNLGKYSVLHTTEDFVKSAKVVHGDRYGYDHVTYSGALNSVSIECFRHGLFTQTAYHHLRGHGCSSCNKCVSNKEREFLDFLNVPVRSTTLWIGTRRFWVDGYDPKSNTVYEFYGDFWHGNPRKYNSEEMNTVTGKTFGELYTRTLERENALRAAGFVIKSVWESDWVTK